MGGTRATERPFPRRGNFVYPTRLLIEDSTLVIFARFEREEGGVRARLIVLCDFVRGTIVAQLMIERFCNDFGWKSCTLEIIDIVFQFDIFSIYRC